MASVYYKNFLWTRAVLSSFTKEIRIHHTRHTLSIQVFGSRSVPKARAGAWEKLRAAALTISQEVKNESIIWRERESCAQKWDAAEKLSVFAKVSLRRRVGVKGVSGKIGTFKCEQKIRVCDGQEPSWKDLTVVDAELRDLWLYIW